MEDRFLERMDQQLAGWSDPPTQLRAALEQDQLELYCQPILALAAERGATRFPMAEVLVRMREEERALLPPGDFLPVFEHYGMMPQLDRWVVRQVVRQLARGSRISRFTINVSGQTLQDAEFPAFVAAELRAAGVAMEAAMFEVDESDLLERLDVVTRFGAAVKAYGGGLLIDGFCNRAVSFAPFKTLRIDYVKVDGRVIRKLLASEAAQAKLTAVLGVAEVLGFGVVAECVEEQGVLDRLKALKVGYAQGFGVLPPQPMEKVAGKA